MHYKNSGRFEEAVFGRCSGDQGYSTYRNFNDSMADLIRSNQGVIYPQTRLGSLLYFGVYRGLEKSGVDPSSLSFNSALGSRVDIHHFADGYFRLSSIPEHLVTVDLFNLDSDVCQILQERWDSCNESDFQTNLFSYKKGMADAMKVSGRGVGHWDQLFSPPSLVAHASRRPENHFVLTPFYTEGRESRKLFTQMVAGYMAGIVKKSTFQNMAQLSR